MPTRSLSLLAFCVALWAPGCGLVLDLDPPDPDGGEVQRFDAGLDGGSHMDAGPHDAGGASDASVEGDASISPDDGSIMVFDATSPRDATVGPADAGPRPCTSHDDCGATHLCRRAPGTCYGPGECAPRPAMCPDVVAPVCGCDWHLYDNACEAEAAGANVMRSGSCPSPTADWCPRTVAAAPGPGCTRCFDDRDCNMLPLAPYCVSSSCTEGGEGYCALGPLARPECWDARQCRLGERCAGARYDSCELPVRSGRCE